MRRFAGFLLTLLVVIVGLLNWGAWAVWRTRPPDSETLALLDDWPGDAGPRITIDYDSLGVPTVEGASETALAFGQGYAHARDRRFQMELYRKTAGGRLAELVGPDVLPVDRYFRMLGFTTVADSALRIMEPRIRALNEAYAAGVRAYEKHHPSPPEFLAFGGRRPEPWQARDCVLVELLMFDDLNSDGIDQEEDTERMDASLPASLVAFLKPVTTPFDAPLDARAGGPAAGLPASPPIPEARAIDLRPRTARRPAPGAARTLASHVRLDVLDRGSNNWAIAADRTAGGGAIVAGDPHLTLRVPVIWHRQRLEGAGLSVTGVSLPGLPGIVFGTNRRVAWTGTNLEGDCLDLVRVLPFGTDSTRYVGPHGIEPFGIRREILTARGAPAETLLVRTTRFGPVLKTSARGGMLAVQWTALDPAIHSTSLYDLARAGSVRDLFARLADYGGPALNIVAGDDQGHVGWKAAGRLPRRAGFDSSRPREGRDPHAGWFGYVRADSMPQIVDPKEGFVATANQRTLAPDRWSKLGNAPAMPWRARRIRDVLSSRSGWTVAASCSLQNDVDDRFLEITWKALDRAIPQGAETAADTTLAAVRRALDNWSRRADTTSVAHAYLRQARTALSEALIDPLVEPCVSRDTSFVYDWSLTDEVVRRLLEERPPHLLDPAYEDYEDYDALVQAAARRAASELRARAEGAPLDSIPWGRINRARFHHPLGDALPALGSWLNLPHAALAGDAHVVRMARPRSGASMRMVVDLAAPANSRFALPGGQSGHFLSPHYSDHFADWVAGRTVPLLPGPARATIVLTPSRKVSR